MRYRIFISLFFVIFFGIISGCERKWTGDIIGVVTDTSTEEPLEGILITASSMKNDYAVSTTTRADGSYRIMDARWGPNKVECYHPNYYSVTRYADVVRNKSVSLDLQLTKVPPAADPLVTFWLTDSANIPIANARLDVYHKDQGSFEFYTYMRTYFSDGDGYSRVQFAEITENQIKFYRVKISVPGFKFTTYDLTISWLDPYPTIHIQLEREE